MRSPPQKSKTDCMPRDFTCFHMPSYDLRSQLSMSKTKLGQNGQTPNNDCILLLRD